MAVIPDSIKTRGSSLSLRPNPPGRDGAGIESELWYCESMEENFRVTSITGRQQARSVATGVVNSYRFVGQMHN